MVSRRGAGSSLDKRLLSARQETKEIDFKESFDADSLRAWCELIKDLVAMANSGGGIILVGLDNEGNPVGSDVSGLLRLDPATLSDKVHRYTGIDFSDFEILKRRKASNDIGVINISASPSPIVFVKPGTYPLADGKQGSAFSQGTVYFRHGAKSEPGTTNDLRGVIEKRVKDIRKEWLSGVRKVVKAEPGSVVSVLPPDVRISDSPSSIPIRIVDDPKAQAFRQIDPNETHPFRQKDVISEVRKHLPITQKFNQFDVYTIRKVHQIDGKKQFYYRPVFGSPQFSNEFVKWIIEQHKHDEYFFRRTRGRFRRL